MKRYSLSGVLLCMAVLTVHVAVSQQCPGGCTCTATTVDCRNIDLQVIPDLSDYGGTAVRTMDFSYNEDIRVIMPDTFAGISVRTLNLRDIGLTSINRNAFANIAFIETLILDYNQASYDPDYSNFDGLWMLKKFSANYQGLVEFPAKVICDFKSLEELSLVGNSITRLDRLCIPATCKTLRRINLSNNAITYIEPSVFTKLNGPVTINLRNNALQELGFLFSLCQFQYVYLDENPDLECSCEFISLNMHDQSSQLSGTCTVQSRVDAQTKVLDLSSIKEEAGDIAYYMCLHGPVEPVNCGR